MRSPQAMKMSVSIVSLIPNPWFGTKHLAYETVGLLRSWRSRSFNVNLNGFAFALTTVIMKQNGTRCSKTISQPGVVLGISYLPYKR